MKNISTLLVVLLLIGTTIAPNVVADVPFIDVKPDSPKDNDDLNCYVNGAQPGAYQYWWYKNGLYQPAHYDSPIVSASATSPGDVWTCSVKVQGSSVPVGEDSVTVKESNQYNPTFIPVFIQIANRAPVLNDVGNKVVGENQLLSFTVYASDPDGDALSFSASNLPNGASFNSATRTFSWTPSYDQAGVYSVTFSVTDGNGGLDSETVMITVQNTNRPPILGAISDKSASVNALLAFDVTGSDLDKDPLSFSASNVPAGATFSDVCTATWKSVCLSYAHHFSWKPVVSQAGSYDVTFNVSDDKGASDTQVVKITIKNVKVLIEKANAAPSADFFFVPLTPLAGKPVTFTSASTDPDGEALSLAWDFNNDGITDATGVVATHTFTKPGSQPVKLTANDGSLSNTVTKSVPVGAAAPATAQCQDNIDNDGDGLADLADPGCSDPLDNDESDGTTQCQDGKDNDGDGLIDFPVDSGCSNKQDDDEYNAPEVHVSDGHISNINCFSKVVEGEVQECTVKVMSDGSPVSGANVGLFSLHGQYLGNCITGVITGECIVAYPAGNVGMYAVYAVASLFGDVLDEDNDPQFTYEVVEKTHNVKTLNINDLAVYSDEDFSIEDYDFFRQETMYVKFSVTDEFGVPYDDAITSVSLISPSDVHADFVSAKQSEGGKYYYKLQIPATHDFFGNSQVFTFAFRFDDGTGDQRVAMVKIRNNPPVILSGPGRQIEGQTFSTPTKISLTQFESDVEDSGDGLRWFVSGIDPTIFDASVDAGDQLTIIPVSEGVDVITLTLTDLDGDSDLIYVRVNAIGTPVVPACRDYLDNDFDGYIDLVDPGCMSRDDNDEFNAVAQSQCSDGIDNDGDRKVDLSDPDCVAPEDNREGPNPLPEPTRSLLDIKEIFVSRIMLNGVDIAEGYAFAGDVAALSVSFENKLGHSANRVRVEASVDDLGIRDAEVIDFVRNGQMVTAQLELEIPGGVPPGYYDVRVVVSNDDERRVKYRTIVII